MLLAGLTGGIGSGKSTVAAGLGARGASVVDADVLAREVLEPGGIAYQRVVDRFGPAVVTESGTIDRSALAAIVFSDGRSLADLNRITHPAIGLLMAERVANLASTSEVIVLDIPLLTIATKDRFTLGGVIVVDTPEEMAVARLVDQRGFAEEDARARVAAQISREERRALADLVLDNSGDRDDLELEIDRAWVWLQERAAAKD